MSKVKYVKRKSFKIRPSGRSSDFITPSFGFGCLLNCSYCYMKRHVAEGLSVATNTDDIIDAIHRHSETLGPKVPNQTSDKYWTYDISCNEDFALHVKYHDWEKIFNYFKYNSNVLATFATKVVPDWFLSFNPRQKVRIRFSLMPERLSNILEPNTPKISDRIRAIVRFLNHGYDVHLNFSPVVIYEGWTQDYRELFKEIDDITDVLEDREKIKAEVIFLTHNEKKHKYNLDNNLPGEDLLWRPGWQEQKISQYGGENLRYKLGFKSKAIEVFKEIHDEIIPWNEIRYIF